MQSSLKKNKEKREREIPKRS